MTSWQKIIYINYGTVPIENIAKVIKTDVETVIYNAEKLGLSKIKFDKNWVEKGFVTIIRNNWDLLEIDDIAVLLGIKKQELKILLVEYDFLDIKLGEKPATEDVTFRPLTEEEENVTERIRKLTEENYISPLVSPFDFFAEEVQNYYIEPKNCLIEERFTSSYNAKYSGALLDDDISDYSVDYLKRLKSSGINGIWLSDTMRNLAEFPFDKSLSPDYEIRIKNLRKLTERCAKMGVNVYLYLNEPRSLPESFFVKYPNFKGQLADDGTYCLCTSNKEVLDYIYNAIKSIAKSVPLLKGVMTITMSENPTHCYARRWGETEKLHTECPRCSKRKPEEIVSELNNTISRALKDGNGKTKLIANVWGWRDFREVSDENAVYRCIDALDKDIELLCVSEYAKEFVRGGVNCRVGDYSISVIGPGEFAKELLSYAKNKGHKIWAKVQLNNSWECSAVPFIPVFDLMLEHIENLKELKVDGLMTGWSLGGYPGGALSLCNSACGVGKFDDKEWYRAVYDDNAEIVKQAVGIFSTAFRDFPFSVDSIYFGGHNLGCGNVWSLEKQNRQSTMVCFTFDDYDKWAKPYGIDIYTKQLQKLTSEWINGTQLLEGRKGNNAYNELIRCAIGAYCHFKSSYNLACCTVWKKEIDKNKEELLELLQDERQLTKTIYDLISKDAKIGFEMTNHYYYNANLLLYKLCNLTEIEEVVKNYK